MNFSNVGVTSSPVMGTLHGIPGLLEKSKGFDWLRVDNIRSLFESDDIIL